jgi:hypothetical protein
MEKYSLLVCWVIWDLAFRLVFVSGLCGVYRVSQGTILSLVYITIQEGSMTLCLSLHGDVDVMVKGEGSYPVYFFLSIAPDHEHVISMLEPAERIGHFSVECTYGLKFFMKKLTVIYRN